MAPLILALMLSVGSSAPQQNDLRITIARIETADSKPSNPEFAITLENQSDQDFVVLLGWMLGNGRTMFPVAVSLTLTDQGGRLIRLRYRTVDVVGGTIEDYVVPLRHRAAYVLRVSLADYDVLGWLGPTLSAGSYCIQASMGPARPMNMVSPEEIRGKLPPRTVIMNLWMGTASSNVLAFSIP